MKMFCTGNPKRKTIAYILQPFESASLTSGWDFTQTESVERFGKIIGNYNIFVNSAFVAPGIQEQLMLTCHKVWMQQDIKGHIVNIGTTLENTDNTSPYNKSKKKFRKQSLQLSDDTGISGVKTTYVVLGGIGEDMCDIQHIGSTIKWIIKQPFRIPIIQIESVK
jgi:hypothetical protein